METNKIINADCLEEDGLKSLPDASIDLLVTDPPYFLPVIHYQTRKKNVRNFADMGIVEHFFKDVFKEIQRVMKPSGRLYIFCDGQSYPIFYYHLYPFVKSLRPLIWDKKTSINGYSWRHQHELIIFAEMPEARPVPSGDGDILRFNAVKIDERSHPAEKPVELLMQLIKKSSVEGNIVLDPFGGSGSTARAAQNLNRRFIVFEKGKDYAENAERKLSEKQLKIGELKGVADGK